MMMRRLLESAARQEDLRVEVAIITSDGFNLRYLAMSVAWGELMGRIEEGYVENLDGQVGNSKWYSSGASQ